jgi:hypothetical protein
MNFRRHPRVWPSCSLPLVASMLCWLLLSTAQAQDSLNLSKPIAKGELVFEERDGLVAFEAEHFIEQTKAEKRAWYRTTEKDLPSVMPDGDAPHWDGASGGAYLELLPDTRRTSKDKLVKEENFVNEPGKMAVLTYQVYFNTPGTYWIWARVYSTTTEDNGLHFGIDDVWPESASRWQTVVKDKWHWESKQRTETIHTGVPEILTLEVSKEGLHRIHVAMREDGIELDRILLANQKDYRPMELGPPAMIRSGNVPSHFALMAGLKNRKVVRPKLIILAKDIPLEGTSYALDQGRWLAITPESKREAQVQTTFPFATGRYKVVFQAVGEDDGASEYRVACNGQEIGSFKCPLATVSYEEGEEYQKTWENVELHQGDKLDIGSNAGSINNNDFSRGRWSYIGFVPADDATKAANEKQKEEPKTNPR